MTKFKNYFNAILGNDRIFSREDIAKMDKNEFSKNEKAIIDSTRVKAGLETNLNTFKDTIFDIFKSVTNIDLQKI